MKILSNNDGPSVRDFVKGRDHLFLVRRVAIISANDDSTVLAVLSQGDATKTFVQAYSLDSWVVAGCHQRDVLKKEQVKALLELSPRYTDSTENWNFLEDKAKLGELKEMFKRNPQGLAVKT